MFAIPYSSRRENSPKVASRFSTFEKKAAIPRDKTAAGVFNFIFGFYIFLNLLDVFNKDQNARIADFIYLQSVIGLLPLTPKN